MIRRDFALKIETQLLDNNQARLTVEIDPAQLEEAKHKAARKISQRVRIPGFRPGKAPYPVVLRSVGDAAVTEEAVEALVNETYPKAIEESGLKPYAIGSLEKFSKEAPTTFEFVVPLEPTVKLAEYHGIRFPYELQPVTDEKVEETIEGLRSRSAVLEPVQRPAEVGDEVFIRINAERKVAEEGKSMSLINDHSTSVVIDPPDSDKSKQWPFPGFAETLVGLVSGDEKTFDYKYPDDSPMESLRGTEAIFHFKVEEVKHRSLPELNDEFAQTMGEYDTMEALRTEIRKNLDQQAKEEYDTTYTDQILDVMLKDAEIKYPPQMLESEINSFVRQLESRLSQQNLDMATYLKVRQLDEAGLRKEIEPNAEKRLRRSLVLMDVAKQENIQIDEKEVEQEASRTYSMLQQYADKEQVRRMRSPEFVQSMVGSISADLMVAKSVERLKAIAKGEIVVDMQSLETLSISDVAGETVESKPAEPAAETTPVAEVKPETEAVTETPQAAPAAEQVETPPTASAPAAESAEAAPEAPAPKKTRRRKKETQEG